MKGLPLETLDAMGSLEDGNSFEKGDSAMGIAGRMAVAVSAVVVAVAATGLMLLAPYEQQRPSMESVYAYRQGQASADGGLSHDTSNPGEADPSRTDPAIDWAGLAAANPDVRGWVSAPGTSVDYPVVQAHADAPERYLWVDFNGQESYYGCPYLDPDNEEQGGLDSLSPIVYGHHLVNGEMFSDFARYSDPTFAAEHATILLDAQQGRRTLRVVAANVVDADVETVRTSFADAADLSAYLAAKLAESEVVLEDPGQVDRLYSFVTCSYGSNNERTIVYAVEE